MTVTIAVAVFLQLFTSVPVTVYVVVIVGFTLFVEPLPKPLLQEYVIAPPAVIFCEFPLQIMPPPAVTVGNAFTFIIKEPLAVAEEASVTVTK